MKKVIEIGKFCYFQEETLSDGSKVYNVIVGHNPAAAMMRGVVIDAREIHSALAIFKAIEDGASNVSHLN